ncbi:MAG: glycosyltransferase [Myxococcota bacterium]
MTDAATDASRREAPAVFLDITRSLLRAGLQRPTGIDRVEQAYLDWAVNRPAGTWLAARIGGEGADGTGTFGARLYLVPPARARKLAAALRGGTPVAPDIRARLARWQSPEQRLAASALRRAASHRLPLAGRRLGDTLRKVAPGGAFWLNVGHENLSQALLQALSSADVAPVVLLHDLIPITHPEFAREEAARRFRRRLDAALSAHLIVYNSEATRRGVQAYAELNGLALPEGAVLPLGVVPPVGPEGATLPRSPSGRAGHFVQLGTIEGRKNHILTLMLWRGLSEGVDAQDVPHLHVVGRRGWSADQAIAMLDRSDIVGRTVFEHSGLEDRTVAALLSEARALLFPSFAEGYGLPLGEALAAGVPVIAADLPALRELGGDVPEWIAPQDGPGWLKAIRDYAQPGSPRRNAQLARLAEWERPRWEDHFAALDDLLDDLAR